MSKQLSSDWTAIFSSSFIPKLELLRSMLEENNIPVILHNQADRSYGFGEGHLMVKNEDVVRAKHLLKEEL